MHNSTNRQSDENNKEAGRLAEANKLDRNKKRLIESQNYGVKIEKLMILAQEAAEREQKKWVEAPLQSSGTHSSADFSQKQTDIAKASDVISNISFTLGDFDDDDFTNIVQSLFANNLPAQTLWMGTFRSLGQGFLTQNANDAVTEVMNLSPAQSNVATGVVSNALTTQPAQDSEAGQESGRHREPEATRSNLESTVESHPDQSEFEKELRGFLCNQADNSIDNGIFSFTEKLIAQSFMIKVIPALTQKLAKFSYTLELNRNIVFSTGANVIQMLCVFPFIQKEKILTRGIGDPLFKNSNNPYHSFKEWESKHIISANFKLVPKGGRARRFDDEENSTFSSV